MTKTRLELHEELTALLGSRYVYYQPPASVRMTYPAIVYSLLRKDNFHSNDATYNQRTAYLVTLIDKNPDSPFIEPLSKFPYSRLDRTYVADNLNHFVFTIFY